jgi:long-subunit fatty acid transport protein
LSTASYTGQGAHQASTQWALEASSLGIKWSGLEVDPSVPSSAEVKNAQNYTYTPVHVYRDTRTLAFTVAAVK